MFQINETMWEKKIPNEISFILISLICKNLDFNVFYSYEYQNVFTEGKGSRKYWESFDLHEIKLLILAQLIHVAFLVKLCDTLGKDVTSSYSTTKHSGFLSIS